METRPDIPLTMPAAEHPKRTLRWALIGILLFWAVVVALLMQRQAIADWWQLRDYTPPAAVVALADDVAMTDHARKLFYVNDPQIEDASTFNQHCRTGEYTIVLGCYISGDRGIYVFAIDDERLDGIKQVTAAHEMLHAAYERLPTKERQRVDRLTAAVFANLQNDRVTASIDRYRDNDPSVVPNELHSILGTEVALLSPELEEYYTQYFTDRSRVVAYAEQYEAAFESRKTKIADYEAQLTDMQTEITARSDVLKTRAETLEREYADLEAQRGTISAADFNQRAVAYNAEVAGYNSEVQAVGALITTYNETYDAYTAVVLEQQDLFKAIDSRPQEL